MNLFFRIIVAGIAAALLVGCAEDPSPFFAFDPSGQLTRRGIASLCAGGGVVRHEEEVVFPDPGATCAFGAGENLTKKNGFVRARAEQVHALGIPTGSLLCEASLSSPTQAITFDDEVFLTFNDVILMMSQPNYKAALPLVSGFLRFDWERLKNQNNGHSDGHPFCLGAAEGTGSCSLPPTQTTGSIQMDWGKEAMAALSEKIQSEKRRELTFITTGDNNTSDCRHSEIRLSVNLAYVLPN